MKKQLFSAFAISKINIVQFRQETDAKWMQHQLAYTTTRFFIQPNNQYRYLLSIIRTCGSILLSNLPIGWKAPLSHTIITLKFQNQTLKHTMYEMNATSINIDHWFFRRNEQLISLSTYNIWNMCKIPNTGKYRHW